MKRFYKKAEAGTAPGGHVVRLDGKVLQTPLRKPLIVGARLAAAIAREWDEQGDTVVPTAMPMTRLANTMTDKAAGNERPALNDEVCRYAESDLVCYFAALPPDLVARQKAAWEPLLAWMKERFGADLIAIHGIRYQAQPTEALAACRRAVEDLDAGGFTVVQAVVGVTGSVVLALALWEGFLTPEQVFQAATIDEVYQLEKWGEDSIARARLEKIRHEIQAIADFKACL